MSDRHLSRKPVFLVLTPENRILECVTDLERAQRTAKAIGGYLAEVPIVFDYRRP